MKTPVRFHVLALGLLYALVSLVTPASQVTGDTWFNLVQGRAIAVSHSLPRTNTLTVTAHGAPWIDAQWLAHLAWFALARATGGLAMLVVVRTALVLVALLLPLLRAVRRGCAPSRAMLAGGVALALVAPHAGIRAQSFAEPLFALVAVLVADDIDHLAPARRVWVAIPLALVWANVHGSAPLAALLVALGSIGRVVKSFRTHTPRRTVAREIARGIALTLFVGVCAFTTPYGFALVGQLRETLFNPLFRAYVLEWRPPSLVEDPAHYAIAALAVVLFARVRTRATLFESLLVLTTGALALVSFRHGLFFGLAIALVFPRWLDLAISPRSLQFDSPRFFRAVSILLGIGTIAAACVVLARFDAVLARAAPRATAQTVAQLAGPYGTVFADEGHADRLMYQSPDLEGRMAFDGRLELVDGATLEWLVALHRGDAPAIEQLGNYSLVVLDRRERPALVRAVASDPAFREVAGDPSVRVFARGMFPVR